MRLVLIVVRNVYAQRIAHLAPSGNAWIDPLGGSFSAKDSEALTDFARGHTGRLELEGRGEIRGALLTAEIEDE